MGKPPVLILREKVSGGGRTVISEILEKNRSGHLLCPPCIYFIKQYLIALRRKTEESPVGQPLVGLLIVRSLQDWVLYYDVIT